MKNVEKTLLMVIDIQEKLMPSIYKSQEIIKNTTALIKAFNQLELKVIATEQYPKGLGASLQEISENIKRENIFEKTSFKATTEEVLAFLKENNIETVVITGAEAHVCVYQSVVDLLERGYQVILIDDGISSYSEVLKATSIREMTRLGARLYNSEMLLFDLIEDSRNPNFKFISSLVKGLRS